MLRFTIQTTLAMGAILLVVVLIGLIDEISRSPAAIEYSAPIRSDFATPFRGQP
jgi:hypothetical protein